MDNLEIERIINKTGLDNPIVYFFEWLRITGYIRGICILEILEYYYVNGFQQFTNLEWGKKIKIDYRVKRVTKPFALLTQSIYNMCKECHTLQDISGVHIYHSNAYKWFINCFLELIYLDFIILTSSGNTNYLEIWESRVKTFKQGEYPSDFEYCVKHTVTDIPKNLDNNYNPFIKERCFNLAILIESAYSLKETNPSFTKYWTPFIEAQKSIIKLKHDKYLVSARLLPDDIQIKQQGRGRYRKSK